MVSALLSRGRLNESLELCNSTSEIPDAESDQTYFSDSITHRAYWVGFRAILLSLTGRMDAGAAQIRHADELARQTHEPETRGYVHGLCVQHAVLTGDVEMAIEQGTLAVELAEETEIPLQLADGYLALGDAQLLAERWQDALKSLHRTGEIIEARANLSALKPRLLTSLAQAHLGVGDDARALYYAEELLTRASNQDLRIFELNAHLIMVRAMLDSHAREDADAIQSGLATVFDLVEKTNALAYRPTVHLLLAQIAQLADDPERRALQLGQAHRLYSEMGARGHARSIAVQLAYDQQLAQDEAS
jgi:tetratricopeptide (TPR) repeat protein